MMLNGYVSIQRFEFILSAKLEYRIKHENKAPFPSNESERTKYHFLVNCGTKYNKKMDDRLSSGFSDWP